ncbi:eCIS core domain-containing protein [Mucilaginibacter ginsenosidivorax]|uniref:DUF4157 domain-containing protein n=1 Tax=Mucilaginibacter ginsenosidivorax TaxID=862126 RepID=A0A5B8W4Z4_9SPHI|nr:DUF4157 domain-containing protein [Mucilaginibacter ginsenosidivorax]QEC78002.1 DUF4157 domain-containing protein [Mucilaginibacter ginsenosidivorax]
MKRYRQRSLGGNRAITSSGVANIQRKLAVGETSDPMEYQADDMADKVMRMPVRPLVQRNAGDKNDENIKRKPLTGQITPFIQAKGDAGGVAGPAVTNGIQATQGGGKPMDGSTKSFMESRFGNDFSNVRIHTGDYAAQMSKELNAHAFTVGNDIYFNSGKYAPDASGGKHLLAHELTHVVQQSGSIGRKVQRQPGEKGQEPVKQTADKTVAQTDKKPDAQPEHKPEKTPEQDTPITMKDKVRAWLDSRNFDIPAAAEKDIKSKEDARVHYKTRLWTVENVADDVLIQLNLTQKDKAEVLKEVKDYYEEKKNEAEGKNWSLVAQLLYTPQYTLATNQPGGSPAQHSTQLSIGGNRRYHLAGTQGFEMTYQGSLSLFNFGTGTKSTAADIFQNLMFAVQPQYVWNLGKDFHIPHTDQWANVQASIFAQLAAGVGSNWTDEGATRKVYLGFLVQPAAGGQVNLNISWFQVILNGQLVGSFLSPTYQPKSEWTKSLGVQAGVGVGGQF